MLVWGVESGKKGTWCEVTTTGVDCVLVLNHVFLGVKESFL